jgi:hypothetical protein
VEVTVGKFVLVGAIVTVPCIAISLAMLALMQ